MPSDPQLALGVVILAAGKSSRMGSPKLLLPWSGTTVLGHLIHTWSQLPASQIVVVHEENNDILAELERLQFPFENRVQNPQPQRGMFSSVQCAAKWKGWKPELSHWAITLGDQPQLKLGTLQALAAFAQKQPEEICQPSYRGRPKHPVIFSKKEFRILIDSMANNLKDFLASRSNAVRLIELDDAGLDFDLDTPSDYETALKHFRSLN